MAAKCSSASSSASTSRFGALPAASAASSSAMIVAAPPRLSGLYATRVIDEDLPHQPRGQREEMRAVVHRHAIEIDEPKVRLVDEHRRLQRVAGAFVLESCACDAPQFVVDDRKQLVQGGFIALAPLKKQRRDRFARGVDHVAGRVYCVPAARRSTSNQLTTTWICRGPSFWSTFLTASTASPLRFTA